MEINEIGNNRYVIDGEHIHAPNIATAIQRAENQMLRLIETSPIPLTKEDEYHLKEAYTEELSHINKETT